ncbi:MAG: hypothetical protein GC192_24655 [Bacteroidetes bacterium]|nr:hypothetical protein [Bacteroidota bacterium]
MKTFIFSFLLAIPLLFSFSASKTMETTCPTPTNGHVTSKSSGTISFDWDDCGCAGSTYKIWYYRSDDSYTSPEYSTSTSYYTFNSLSSGTYTFYYKTVCIDGESDGIIVVDEVVM